MDARRCRRAMLQSGCPCPSASRAHVSMRQRDASLTYGFGRPFGAEREHILARQHRARQHVGRPVALLLQSRFSSSRISGVRGEQQAGQSRGLASSGAPAVFLSACAARRRGRPACPRANGSSKRRSSSSTSRVLQSRARRARRHRRLLRR